jgi:hypothetical protein
MSLVFDIKKQEHNANPLDLSYNYHYHFRLPVYILLLSCNIVETTLSKTSDNTVEKGKIFDMLLQNTCK